MTSRIAFPRIALPRIALPSWLIRLLQIAGLVVLVGLLWWHVDWRAALDLLGAADLRWLALAFAALTLQTVLSALRWRITAQRLGIMLTRMQAIREYYLSQLVNQSLPGGVIGDAGRALRARGQAGLLASGQAVLFERLAGQIGLVAVLVAGIAAALLLPDGLNWPLWLIGPVAACLTGLAIAIALTIRLSAGTQSAAQRFARAFTHAVTAPDIRHRQAALSLATALANVAAFAFCARALGVNLPMLVALTIVPLILFAMVLPVTISGWGLREGAAAALFPVIGASSSAGLATSIAFGLVFFATVLPGLLVSWLRPNAPVIAARNATYD